MTEPTEFLHFGTVVGPHGRHGSLYLRPFSGEIGVLEQALPQLWLGSDPDLAVPYTLRTVRPFKLGALVELVEVSDRSRAEELQGKDIWLRRCELPALAEGEWYLDDLIGAPVLDASGVTVGRLEGYQENPAGLLLQINRGNRSVFVPWIPQFVAGIEAGPNIQLTENAPVDL